MDLLKPPFESKSRQMYSDWEDLQASKKRFIRLSWEYLYIRSISCCVHSLEILVRLKIMNLCVYLQCANTKMQHL